MFEPQQAHSDKSKQTVLDWTCRIHIQVTGFTPYRGYNETCILINNKWLCPGDSREPILSSVVLITPWMFSPGSKWNLNDWNALKSTWVWGWLCLIVSPVCVKRWTVLLELYTRVQAINKAIRQRVEPCNLFHRFHYLLRTCFNHLSPQYHLIQNCVQLHQILIRK